MKKCLSIFFIMVLFMGCLLYHEQLTNYLLRIFTDNDRKISTLVNNQYAKNNNYEFVKITDDFIPKNKNDILNIYYTVLNSGMTEFSFYCPTTYVDCVSDINYISKNQALLSHVNNFVPVYNSFKDLETNFDSLGNVTINITYNYTKEQIIEIDKVINEIVNGIYKKDLSLEENIKALHNYVINTTKYDIDRSDKQITNYLSDNAYGALIEHYAICGGYADSMKLLLDKINVPNIKISSENHIWNLVYINDGWYHLDLTWDDPVTSTGEDVLEYDYFLIDTEELKELDIDQHLFDEEIYIEAK